MKDLLTPRPWVLLAFALLAVLGRVALPHWPHLPNFAPLDSLALFWGAYFARRHWAVLVPLLGVWLSDLVLNYQYLGHVELFYSGFYWQYGTYALLALLDHAGLRGRVSAGRVAGAGLGAAAVFFLISNFGVWLGSTTYPQTGAGLLTCYAAGLPFITHSLLSNLFYCMVLFGGFELAQRRFPVLAYARSPRLARA